MLSKLNSSIFIKLVDTEGYEYKYETGFKVMLPPLCFSESLPSYEFTNGVTEY